MRYTRWIVLCSVMSGGMLLIAAQDHLPEHPVEARVEIVDAENTSEVLGVAVFTERAAGGVVATFDIHANDVIPGGLRAIHLHENGACGRADADGDGIEEPAGAAGGHYNPTQVVHGEAHGPHTGDSEEYNYEFAEDGSFAGEVVFPEPSLVGGHSMLADGGVAIVIHEGVDDKTTDPDGASGTRIACGVLAEVELP